jgi:hypothetical protein
VFTSPFGKGGLRGDLFKKISPNPSFSKRGTEQLPVKLAFVRLV